MCWFFFCSTCKVTFWIMSKLYLIAIIKKKKARIRWSVFFSTLFVLSTVYHATDHSFHVNSFLCFKILFFIISFSFYLYSCFSFSFPSFASSALLKRLMLPKISTLFIVPSPSHTFDFTFWLMTRKYYI